MISNLFQRLDLLKRAYTQLSFTLQLFDTNTNTFVDLSTGTFTIRIVDDRGSQYNTSMPNLYALVANDKVQIDIHNAIAPDRISTLKYSISYTNANSVETGLLMGVINCVDLAHMPSNTSNYIPNGSNIVVSNAVGTSTNVILELQNGLNGATGATGAQGIQGVQGAQGHDGNDATATIVDVVQLPAGTVAGKVALDLATVTSSLLVLCNSSSNTVDVQLDNGAQLFTLTHTTTRVLAGKCQMLVNCDGTLALLGA